MSRRFLITLVILWVAGAIAGTIYSQQKDIPANVALAAGLAMLVELTQYASLAFEEMRSRWQSVPLAILAPLSYIIYSAPAGVFTFQSLLIIWVAAALLVAWFQVLPRSALTDIGFVLVAAAPLVFRLIEPVYVSPTPNLDLDILGKLLWIRLGVLVILHHRPQRGIHFGFIPTRDEWKTGLLYGALTLCAVLPLTLAIGFARFAPPNLPWWSVAGIALGNFLGILWVVALMEEFFFRGLLLQWIAQWTGSFWAGLIVSSALFGSVHLNFREFPNWRFMALASVAGVFYGLAFRKGGGIRAAMVAHALLVMVWKTAFR